MSSKASKLLIAAIGPGVGGIKVWEEYRPPDNDKFKLVREIELDEAIDLEIPLRIKNAESQNTTVPIKRPSILIDKRVCFWKLFSNKLPNFSIEAVSLRNCPIMQLKNIIKPIFFTDEENPIIWKFKISIIVILSSNPNSNDPIKRLITGFNFNLLLRIITAKTDKIRWNKIIIYFKLRESKYITAILIATPFSTWSRIIEFLESATSLLISTPLFIGPGCIIIIFLSMLSKSFLFIP